VKWKDVQPGDVMIDLQFEGNDHILLARSKESSMWLSVATGAIHEDDNEDCEFNETPLKHWEVIRGGRTIFPKRKR